MRPQRHMMKRAIVGLCLLSLAAVVLATPFYTQDPRTLPAGIWRVEEHVIYSNTDSSLADGEKVPFFQGGDFTSFTARTRVRYGISDDLTLYVDAPYVRRRWIQPSGTHLSESGLGDMAFVLKYKYHDDCADRTKRAWALSLKPHTGDSEGLPFALVQGTGTTDWTLTHYWEEGRGNTTWYASAAYVLTGSRADLDLNFGDLIQLNVAAEHRLNERTNFVWELMGRYEGNLSGPPPVPPSGSTIISFSPGFQYTMTASGGRYTTFEAGFPIAIIHEGYYPSLSDYTVYFGGYTVF